MNIISAPKSTIVHYPTLRGNEKRIFIGPDVTFGSNVVITQIEPHDIRIEGKCHIGDGTHIRNSPYSDISTRNSIVISNIYCAGVVSNYGGNVHIHHGDVNISGSTYTINVFGDDSRKCRRLENSTCATTIQSMTLRIADCDVGDECVIEGNEITLQETFLETESSIHVHDAAKGSWKGCQIGKKTQILADTASIAKMESTKLSENSRITSNGSACLVLNSSCVSGDIIISGSSNMIGENLKLSTRDGVWKISGNAKAVCRNTYINVPSAYISGNSSLVVTSPFQHHLSSPLLVSGCSRMIL